MKNYSMFQMLLTITRTHDEWNVVSYHNFSAFRHPDEVIKNNENVFFYRSFRGSPFI